jgi:DNA ligase-1
MKEKEESTGKLTDTIDCIVMGYSSGRGKRANFGIGQFLVGIRDGENYKTISKVGTGLTDEQFKDLKRRLHGLEVEAKPKEYIVNNLLNPDYWVFPELVVEIAADNITQSPSHTAGLALRFPRLVRFRNDKKPQDATSLNELKKIFKLQKD